MFVVLGEDIESESRMRRYHAGEILQLSLGIYHIPGGAGIN